jgi:hypothetical protein
MKKYNAWKANSKCEPIEGTDRILLGENKRNVLRHLAYEEGVEYKHGDLIVKLPNGEMWCVSIIAR